MRIELEPEPQISLKATLIQQMMSSINYQNRVLFSIRKATCRVEEEI